MAFGITGKNARSDTFVNFVFVLLFILVAVLVIGPARMWGYFINSAIAPLVLVIVVLISSVLIVLLFLKFTMRKFTMRQNNEESTSEGAEEESEEEKQSDEEEEESDNIPNEFGEAICPYCLANIKTITPVVLEPTDEDFSNVQVNKCPKCNKILGTMVF